MKFSLMTTTMVIDLLIDLQNGRPKEEIDEQYTNMLKMIARLGIPAVEVTSIEAELFGLQMIQALLKENHLEVGGFVHMDQYACTDDRRSKEIIALAKKRIDDAAVLGTDNLMLALMAQEDAVEHSQEELFAALIRTIRPIAEYGKKVGVMVSVEDTPDIRLPVCGTDDMKKLLEAIPELYLTYDSGNMLIMHEDPISYLKNFRDRICHVHLKDMVYADEGDADVDGRFLTGCMHGEGMVDFLRIGKYLRDTDYEGYAAIEYVGHSGHENKIRDAVIYLNKMMEERK